MIVGRRRSEYFIPIPAFRKRTLANRPPWEEWTADRLQPNDLVNSLRSLREKLPAARELWLHVMTAHDGHRGEGWSTVQTRGLAAPTPNRPIQRCQLRSPIADDTR
jgi:hypothetical protein